MTPSQIIQSLLEERKGYVMRNLPIRVAAVDEALKVAGYVAPSVQHQAPVETPKPSIYKAKKKG
jgi:hypothetical protein